MPKKPITIFSSPNKYLADQMMLLLSKSTGCSDADMEKVILPGHIMRLVEIKGFAGVIYYQVQMEQV